MDHFTPTTHTRRPSDQKDMRFFKDGHQASFFVRRKGCTKTVNGHKPGDIVNVQMVDPYIDPDDWNARRDETYGRTTFSCRCYTDIGVC